jgi:hypothetical protein
MVLVIPVPFGPCAPLLTEGGLVTVGCAGVLDSELGTATVVFEVVVDSSLGAATVVVEVTDSEVAGSREQEGDSVTVLVTVLVTVVASQVGSTLVGGGAGFDPEQAPSSTKNLEVWAWMT